MRNKESRKFIVLVDTSEMSAGLRRYWKISSFLDKVRSLGFPYMLWDGNRGGFLKLLASKDLYAVIHIEGSQIFFDSDLVKRAIKKFKRYKPDYYTQWEHSRIPVGIGVRVFSAKSLAGSGSGSIKEHLDNIISRPDDFSIRYEDDLFTDYAFSMMDSRYSASLDRAMGGGRRVASWDLKGFVKLAGTSVSDMPVYKASAKAARMDDRGMPAPYGFESRKGAEFPSYVMFDVTNICNSSCVHCPHSITYSKTGSSPAFIDMESAKKVLDECRGRKSTFIRLTADGEPLLHKKIAEIVEYASCNNTGPVGLTTNGMLFDRESALRLMDAGLFLVDFSLDAARPETYRKIRRGLVFEKVLNNVESVIKLRDEKRSLLKIMVSFVRQKDNLHEEKEFVDKWEGRADKVLIREMISNVNLIDTGKRAEDGVKRWPCPHLFRRVVINYNGGIKMCPVDWENRTFYKIIGDTDIGRAWHSDFYWKNRIEHLNSDFSVGSACENCRDWQGSPWPLGYEKVVNKLRRR